MNKLYSYIILVFTVSIFNVSNSLYAQDSKKFDNYIKRIRNEMYGNPDKVITAGKEIVSKANSNVDIIIKGNKLISDGYSSKRDYQKAMEYLQIALQLLPQSNDDLLKISIETKAGIQYHQLKIYDKAIQYLDKAEEMCSKYKAKDSINVFLGTNYIVRGFIYKEKLNCDIAISFLEKGIKILSLEKNIFDNANRISIAKYNIGNCYILLENNELAIKNFTEAVYFAQKINANSLQAFAQKGLAQVYTLQGNYNQAIQILNQANQISKEVNDLVLNQELYKGLSENYLALNQWEKHKEFHAKYLKTQSQLKESERKSISNLLAEKENEINQRAQTKFSNFWFIFLGIASVLLIIGTYFSIKKIKQYIVSQKEQIEKIQKENNL